ncbi:hypothetical protein L228DRAFT_247139, partial [Xylona heveae TC161]
MNRLMSLRPVAVKFVALPRTKFIRLNSTASQSSYEYLLVSTPKPGVGLSM